MKHLPALLIGFVLGAAAMCGVVVYSTRHAPTTPELRPATSIEVTLYPSHGVRTDGVPVNIPAEKLVFVHRLLTPETHFEGGVHDFITPIVAEAVVTHDDGTKTTVLVRDHGHNPAVVTLDGRHYFFARNDPDVHAGAIQLARLVTEVRHNEKAAGPPSP